MRHCVLPWLRAELLSAVFNDDKHGTASITLAALRNSIRLLQKDMKIIKVIIASAGGYGIIQNIPFRILQVRPTMRNEYGCFSRPRAPYFCIKLSQFFPHMAVLFQMIQLDFWQTPFQLLAALEVQMDQHMLQL